jgi:DtxR family transcriptional regulator, Mn-dependent transcriptional regulator
MRGSAVTPAMEDYLKAAYLLREQGEEISVLGLARSLAVASSSVTGMVKRLAALGLLHHERYRHIVLTPAGEAVALEIVRHHRLLELYLAEFLDVPWDEVHAEADRLEHHISEELEERIAARLSQAVLDPHGDPIPTRELTVPVRELQRLSDLAPGEQGVVERIADQEPHLLQYLGTVGLVPGAPVGVVAVTPYAGVVTVRVGAEGGRTHMIATELAGRLLVAPTVTVGGGLP